MNEIEYRAVIKYFTKDAKSPTEIYKNMQRVYGNECPSFSTVKKWAALFKNGRESLEDDPRPGRPQDVITHEKVMQVENLLMDDRRVTINKIAEHCKISVGSVETILHKHLGVSKVSARWVPRMLTFEQKKNRVDSCKAAIAQAAFNECGFVELNHPPYSPDLAPSDFFLFPNLKKKLRGKRFSDDNELTATEKQHFMEQEQSYFFDGLMKLIPRSNKCVELRGDYAEK